MGEGRRRVVDGREGGREVGPSAAAGGRGEEGVWVGVGRRERRRGREGGRGV